MSDAVQPRSAVARGCLRATKERFPVLFVSSEPREQKSQGERRREEGGREKNSYDGRAADGSWGRGIRSSDRTSQVTRLALLAAQRPERTRRGARKMERAVTALADHPGELRSFRKFRKSSSQLAACPIWIRSNRFRRNFARKSNHCKIGLLRNAPHIRR